jgi:16S rRNA (uracil1498-N3)-methyltransferase
VIVADLEALELADEDEWHLGKVLRLRTGELVSATDGRGGWRPTRYRPGATLAPDGEISHMRRSDPFLTVGFAPVKGDRPEWAVQKLTEIGIDRILFLRAERSVVRWDDERAARQLARLRAVARQAVMQSRQMWLPELAGVEDAASLGAAPGVAFAVPNGAAPTLAYPTVLIGPEGGWTPSEEAAARAAVRLGPTTLRTESAAVVAGALLAGLRAGLVRSAS